MSIDIRKKVRMRIPLTGPGYSLPSAFTDGQKKQNGMEKPHLVSHTVLFSLPQHDGGCRCGRLTADSLLDVCRIRNARDSAVRLC